MNFKKKRALDDCLKFKIIHLRGQRKNLTGKISAVWIKKKITAIINRRFLHSCC